MKLIKYIFAKSFPHPAVSITSPANPMLTAENPVIIATISFSVYTLFFHRRLVIRTPREDELTKEAVASRSGLAWNFKQWTHQRLQQNANDFQNAIVQQERHEDRSNNDDTEYTLAYRRDHVAARHVSNDQFRCINACRQPETVHQHIEESQCKQHRVHHIIIRVHIRTIYLNAFPYRYIYSKRAE